MTTSVDRAHAAHIRRLARKHRSLRKRFPSQRSHARALYRRIVLGPKA